MTDKEKERLLRMPTSMFVLGYCAGKPKDEIEQILTELQEYNNREIKNPREAPEE